MADWTNAFLDLPEDPEEAYVVYRQGETEKHTSWQTGDNRGWSGERVFVDAILAFDEVFGLEAFPFDAPPVDDMEFATYLYDFRRRSDKLSLKFKLEQARRSKVADLHLVAIAAENKKAIRQFIEAIREQIEAAPLTPDKKAALQRKLSTFAAEVDQHLSRTEAFFQFSAQATKAFRDAGAELKPLTERIDRILDAVEKAQKWFEQLTPWGDRKKIGGPPKQIEGPKSREPTPTDDDTPF